MAISSRSYAPRGYSSGSLPPGVKWLLIANTAVFLTYFLLWLLNIDGIVRWFALIPQAVVHGQIWRIGTYLFLHSVADPFHLLINMLMLYMFGVQLERTWGTRKFLEYYFICGISAGICVVAAAYIFSGNPLIPTMGASGAIFGLLLAFGIVFADATILVFFFFPMAAKYAVMIYGALELYFTVQSPGDGVSHVAHLSGMVFGYIYLKTRARRPKSAPVWASVEQWYQRRKMERAKKKFEVYLRRHRDS